MSNRRIAAVCMALVVPLMGAGHALAQVVPQGASAVTASAPSAVLTLLGARRAVSLGTLAAQRGGTEVADVPTLSGSVGGNTATNTVSGSNSITGGAFANSSGLPVVVQNSGNNVLIQTSTVVNVTIR